MLPPRSVGVIGGGTAGYFAALAIKRRFPDLAVTIVESSAIPIIGVGEATTTLMPPFLHAQLGLSAIELFREVGATFKLGIKFEWGPPGWFSYPFGDASPIEAFAFDGHLREQSLVSMLMGEDRAPVLRGPDGEILSLLTRLKFAYHLDNAPFVAFLAAAARAAGIEHVDVTLDAAIPKRGAPGIELLRAKDGRELRFDFYVDASGFRSLLLEGALGSPFSSYASSLFCDRALVATLPQTGPMEPYTTAETMDAGWCWRIPVRGEDHRGYVFSSAFLSDDQAEAEMRRKNPSMGARSPGIVRFRSGRHRDFWIGNTVAIGNAYGFVEPLESTALHMVILELDALLDGLESIHGNQDGAAIAARASESVGAHWDYLRWFLAVHYKFNGRLDTEFWRAARSDVDVSGLSGAIERFEREGPYLQVGDATLPVGDPSFHYSGLMMLLLGQRVPTRDYEPRGTTRAAWEERKRKERLVVGRALPQADALRVLAADDALLGALLDAPSSWLRRERA